MLVSGIKSHWNLSADRLDVFLKTGPRAQSKAVKQDMYTFTEMEVL